MRRKIDAMRLIKYGKRKEKGLWRAYKNVTEKDSTSVHKLLKINMETELKGTVTYITF